MTPRPHRDQHTRRAPSFSTARPGPRDADTTPRRRSHSSRPIELLRATWGTALLLAPEQVLSWGHHLRVDSTSLTVARILGARHLAQAALSGIRPSPEVLAMGIWVDAAHAATALGLAATDRHRVRAGLIDTAVATVWALTGYRALRTTDATPPGHDRHRDALARAVLHLLPAGAFLLRVAAVTRQESRSPAPARHPGHPHVGLDSTPAASGRPDVDHLIGQHPQLGWAVTSHAAARAGADQPMGIQTNER